MNRARLFARAATHGAMRTTCRPATSSAMKARLASTFAIALLGCGGQVDLGRDRHDDGTGTPPTPDREDARDGSFDPEDARDASSADATADDDGPDDDSGDATSLDDVPDLACTEPTFAGIGAVDTITATTVRLSWSAATHPKTPPPSMVYDVFWSTVAADVFVGPPRRTVPAYTEYVVTGLTAETTYFFGVRARGIDGCDEKNLATRTATTLHPCNYGVVQGIYDRTCAVSGCHVAPAPPGGLSLAPGVSYARTVGVVSLAAAPMKLIEPYDADKSWIYVKMTASPAPGFQRMPPPGATAFPTDEEKDLMRCWINRGAPP